MKVPQPRLSTSTPLVQTHLLQRACACGQHTGGGECTECKKKRASELQRAAVSSGPQTAPPIVHEVLRGGGQPLDVQTRAAMEPRFGRDFSRVRVHTDTRAAESARAVSALAYTVGQQIVFGTGQYAPNTSAGQRLLAHELTHTVQQADHTPPPSQLHLGSPGSTHEHEAEQISASATHGANSIGQAQPSTLQRQVEMRDVGQGEHSGFGRLPELIQRLNTISQGLTFSLDGQKLVYEVRQGGVLSEFDRQMKDSIEDRAVIPLRLTNRRGAMGDRRSGFTILVSVDDWRSGYVDIDDLLASSDLGLQTSLAHLLRERAQTHNYARRLGSESLNSSLPGPEREFNKVHASGLQAELEVLRDFFGDPSIRPINADARLFRNDRGDRIRERQRIGSGAADRGVTAISWEVILHGSGRVVTAEEYLKMLEAERIKEQVSRERLRGATEYREGGRAVPAP